MIPTYSLLTGGSKPAHVGKQAAQTQNYVAKILDMPFGQWMIVVIAITVISVGIFQVCKGFMPLFGCQLDLIKLNKYQLKWVKGFGRFVYHFTGPCHYLNWRLLSYSRIYI